MSRLDRFLVPTDWLNLYPNYVQVALSRPTLDHCLISLDLDMDDWGSPLRLEMIWMMDGFFS